jgi:hypothetical protein
MAMNKERVPRDPQTPAERRPEKPKLIGARSKIDDEQQNINGRIDGKVYSKAMVF